MWRGFPGSGRVNNDGWPSLPDSHTLSPSPASRCFIAWDFEPDVVFLNCSYDLSPSPSIPSTHSSLSTCVTPPKGFKTSDQSRDLNLGAIRNRRRPACQTIALLCVIDWNDTTRINLVFVLALHLPHSSSTFHTTIFDVEADTRLSDCQQSQAPKP